MKKLMAKRYRQNSNHRGRRSSAIARNEVLRPRQLTRSVSDEIPDILQVLSTIVRRHSLNEWMCAARSHALPPHYLQPAREMKQIVCRGKYPGCFTKQLDLVSQAVRHG